MRLNEYPVPTGNNGFGWHWLPQLADVAPLDKTVALLKQMQGTGAKWVKLITSPGGDVGWERGNTNTGACEMTFCAALDLKMGVVVRLYNSWAPPYLTGAVKSNLLHLCHLASNEQFYVECANEIDAEAAGPIDDEMARSIVGAICDFIDWCVAETNGQIVPVWPSFGYGKRTRNWFQIAHDLGRGACIDKCAVAVHNYASANRLFEPWDPYYIAGTPLTQEEYDDYPWRYGVNVIGENPRPIEDINAQRVWNAEHIDESEFASGWYTYKWCLQQLDILGHTDTPLMLTETGTRVGEMVDWEPRIDPALHLERTLGMIEDIRSQPRILMSAFWLFIGKMFVPIQPTWEDQCCISPTWDRKYNATMPEGEYQQIKTPGQLPIIDELEIHPVPEGKYMVSKLYPHIQNYTADVKEMIQHSQPPYVKLMGEALKAEVINEIKAMVARVRIIGRYYVSSQPFNDPKSNALNLVDAIGQTDCASLVWGWESYNEAATGVLDSVQVDLLDQFFAEFHRLIQSRFGVQHTIIVNSPVGNLGWPGEPSPADFWRSITMDGTVLSFHCYEWHEPPANDRTAYLFRWKTLREQVLARYPGKQFLLTEVGVTHATISGQPDRGWREGYSRDEYMQVLIDLDVEMSACSDVLGACVFQTGANPDWATFESTEEVEEIRLNTATPTPVYDIPIRVKRTTGTIETLELELYLNGVLPAEMPALWPTEALKAQAIASRSYALWRIENPRDEATYDLYDDARDQVYNPSMIHPNSTAAVEVTKGVYIVQDTPAQYISRCGRLDCPLCLGSNGFQNGHWLGRLCQYGSQFMAEGGSGYRDILELYYGAIELSTDEPDEGDTMNSTIICDLTDANKYGVTIKPAQVTAGQGYWQVTSFKNLEANDGRHNFYCDVLKDGLRQYGTVIQASWPAGGPSPVTFKIEKPLTEPGGNMAINKHDFLTFVILGDAPCEVISGVNTNFNGDPSTGSSLYHWSFEGIWQWAIAGGEPEPPEPPTEGNFTEQDRDDLEAALRYYDGIIADLACMKEKIDAVLTRHMG